jgi:enoyl-CoA hydratase/carnithine racemase
MLIMTGCNYVVTKPSVEFGLPEVKRGLYPFQVMSSLLEVMPARKVIDWCITGKSISAEEVLTDGLITHVTENIEDKVNEILSTLFENSPNAI